MDGRTDGWTDARTDGCMDACMHACIHICMYYVMSCHAISYRIEDRSFQEVDDFDWFWTPKWHNFLMTSGWCQGIRDAQLAMAQDHVRRHRTWRWQEMDPKWGDIQIKTSKQTKESRGSKRIKRQEHLSENAQKHHSNILCLHPLQKKNVWWQSPQPQGHCHDLGAEKMSCKSKTNWQSPMVSWGFQPFSSSPSLPFIGPLVNPFTNTQSHGDCEDLQHQASPGSACAIPPAKANAPLKEVCSAEWSIKACRHVPMCRINFDELCQAVMSCWIELGLS